MAKKKLSYQEEILRDNLKNLRKKAGLTQEKLAKKTLEDRGASYIANIENGHSKPSIDGMIEIANALGISLDVLCGNNPELTYRDIARSLMLLYFLDDVKINTERDESQHKNIITIKIEHGSLRQFMSQFDSKLNDRTRPQKFLEWLDEELEELDAISPWEEKDSQRWDSFNSRMTWVRKNSGEKPCITGPELKDKFFGGRDNVKLQAQDNKSREEPL